VKEKPPTEAVKFNITAICDGKDLGLRVLFDFGLTHAMEQHPKLPESVRAKIKVLAGRLV
jgi:hypothetical protein